MKKILLLILLIFCTKQMYCEKILVDGMYYNILSDNNVEVSSGFTENAWYAGKKDIPSEIVFQGKKYSVIQIGDEAFKNCTSLTSVTIPNSITKIGASAFSGCTKLTSIKIPDSVTNLGSRAFYNCSGMKSATLSNSIDKIDDQTFVECSSLTSIVIPNSITELGIGTFSNCSSLTSIVIPNSVTKIGIGTFRNCSSLTSVTMSNAIVSDDEVGVSSYVFEGCDNVKELIYADGTKTVVPIYLTSITSVSIPNTATEIKSWTFKDCTKLASVTIPNSVTHIGDEAFQNCSSLTKVNIPHSITGLGQYIFAGCEKLPVTNNIRYADTYLVEVVDQSASQCTIKDGTLYIGNGAFAECNNIVSINIPNSVIRIEGEGFACCSNLKYLSIPESVASIGWSAFYNCKNLREIHIFRKTPPSFFTSDNGLIAYYKAIDTYVNSWGWDYDTAVEYADYNSMIEDPFEGVKTNQCKLYVPEGTEEDYAFDDFWGRFSNIVEFDAAGINNVATDESSSERIFDLHGRELNQVRKGIYIINGKKVLVK